MGYVKGCLKYKLIDKDGYFSSSVYNVYIY